MATGKRGALAVWLALASLATVDARGADGVLLAQATAFDIPAQPLAEALTAFGRQSGWQISYPAGMAQGLRSQPVAGALSPAEALTRLLAGTGVTWQSAGERGAVLERLRASGATQLGPVTVEARQARETASGPVDGYIAGRSASGTKTDTPLLETPRSISVISAEQIDAQKVDDIRGVLRYTPGLVAEARGNDFSQPSLIIRGFQNFDPIYRDGLKGHGRNFFTYASTPLDPYGLERVEVVRGPASILYGQATAGGIVNTVSKRPPEEFFGEIEANGGSFARVGAKFDLGGPIDNDKRFLFRITGVGRHGETQVDTLEEGRAYIAPALTWRPNADTSLTLLTYYQRDDTVGAQIIPANALSNPVGRLSVGTLLSEPDFERFDKNQASFGYIFDHRFDERWQVSHKLRYDRFDVDYRSIYSAGLQADNRTLNRALFTSLEDGDYLTTDSNVQAKFALGPTRHTALVGVDYKRAVVSAVSAAGVAPTLDAFNPVYGQPVAPAPLFQDQTETADQVGLYFQDQIKWGGFVLSFGGRQDWSEAQIDSRLTSTTTRQSDSAFTGQAGLLYLFGNGLAPYVSYAESFEPQSGTDAAGRPFVPTTGTQYEAGVKYQPEGWNGFVTVSAFNLTRQNVLTTDLGNTLFSVQTGEARSRGIELEARARLFDRLNLIAAYAFTQTRVTKSNGTDLGNRLDSVPEHSGSVWADYKISGGLFDGLGFGGGVRYVGPTVDVANTLTVPAVTLVDAAMHYDWQNLRFALNASNLFDETYVSSCFSSTFCYFGTRRVVTASVKYRW